MCGLPRPYAEMKGFMEIGLGLLLVRVTPQAAMMVGSICRKPVQMVVTAQETAFLTRGWLTTAPRSQAGSLVLSAVPRSPKDLPEVGVPSASGGHWYSRYSRSRSSFFSSSGRKLDLAALMF